MDFCRNRLIRQLTATLFVVLVISGCAADSTETKESTSVRNFSPTGLAAPFIPPEGSIYLIAGQGEKGLGGIGESEGYLDSIPIKPSGITLYVAFPDVTDQTQFDLQGQSYKTLIQSYLDQGHLGDSILHLSVQWVRESQSREQRLQAQIDLVEGRYDWFINDLAAFLINYSGPVLLRLGYEFDRPVHFYSSDHYIPAFRRIVHRLREAGVENAAYVWSSSNLSTLTFKDKFVEDNWDFELWYPGDDYVDWFGYSQWFPKDVDSIMLTEARARNKPVIISESTPVEFNVSDLTRTAIFSNDSQLLDASGLWDGWWGPMFDFIESNSDVVKAYHYISIDWHDDSMWSENFLFKNCDSRIWANEQLKKMWIDRISTSPWVDE